MRLNIGRIDAEALISEPENHLVLAPLLAAADCDGEVSVTWVSIKGRHRRLVTHASTRVYAVVEGELEIECDGEPPATIGPGEVAAIPQGVPYVVAGNATYLVINLPGFREGDDEYLE